MSTTPVPRLVGAMWYPVPCPEGVPLTLGFPSEEACASFCEAIGAVLASFDGQLAALEDKHEDALGAAEEAAEEAGRNAEHEDHASGYADACGSDRCQCYVKGMDAGYEQAERDLVPSAESA